MCTICADGTALPPMVIFKGEYFLEKWLQNNPICAMCVEPLTTKMLLLTPGNRICKSAKGWTNGQIGVDWIKFFDDQTHAKLTCQSNY
jgi:hypothetical protein